MTDLLDIIEWSCVECLNQNPSRNIGNALKQVGQCEITQSYIFPLEISCVGTLRVIPS
jgi:hypothetical protein